MRVMTRLHLRASKRENGIKLDSLYPSPDSSIPSAREHSTAREHDQAPGIGPSEIGQVNSKEEPKETKEETETGTWREREREREREKERKRKKSRRTAWTYGSYWQWLWYWLKQRCEHVFGFCIPRSPTSFTRGPPKHMHTRKSDGPYVKLFSKCCWRSFGQHFFPSFRFFILSFFFFWIFFPYFLGGGVEGEGRGSL